MVKVDWKGSMVFEAEAENGRTFIMDGSPGAGGTESGPTPVEALLAAAGACSGIDVMSILLKKRQVVTAYRIEVEERRDPPGEWPRPILEVVVRHFVSGENLDPVAVARAVELSDEKYCTVIATLRHGPVVRSEWEIVSPD